MRGEARPARRRPRLTGFALAQLRRWDVPAAFEAAAGGSGADQDWWDGSGGVIGQRAVLPLPWAGVLDRRAAPVAGSAVGVGDGRRAEPSSGRYTPPTAACHSTAIKAWNPGCD